MKNERIFGPSTYKTVLALLILLAIYTTVGPVIIRAQEAAAKIEAAKKEDPFGVRFREGRILIDKGLWARAAEEFSEALEKYPDHDSADAALYWLAYCYKKQKKYEKAYAALNRLIKKYPKSSWASDAQVMKMGMPSERELRFQPDKVINDSNPPESGQISSDLQEKIIIGNLNNSQQNMMITEILQSTERLPLSRADEIKIAAFQSLLNAEPKRAIETMSEVLKSDSKASENLKISILRIWRSPHLFLSKTLTERIAKSVGEKEFASLLRETLIKSLQSEPNPEIRQELIRTLGSIGDEQTTGHLKRLYLEEQDREIKKAIIMALGNPENSLNINRFFGPGEYDALPNHFLEIPFEQVPKYKLDALLEIIRGEKDNELRSLAFLNLQRFPGWSESAQGMVAIKSLYDSETDEEFKITIIRSLADSKQAAAARKLLDIAKNDKSDKLRLEAIHALRNSQDPEVIKFLQDLIK